MEYISFLQCIYSLHFLYCAALQQPVSIYYVFGHTYVQLQLSKYRMQILHTVFSFPYSFLLQCLHVFPDIYNYWEGFYLMRLGLIWAWCFYICFLFVLHFVAWNMSLVQHILPSLFCFSKCMTYLAYETILHNLE